MQHVDLSHTKSNASCDGSLRWRRPVGQAFKLPMSRPGSQCGPIQIQIANVQRPSNVPVEREQLRAMFPSYMHPCVVMSLQKDAYTFTQLY